MALPLVLLTHPLPAEWVSTLQGHVRLFVGPADPPGFAPHLLEQLGEAEGIFCLLSDKVDQSIIDAAPRLRVVSSMAAGTDNIDIAACTKRRIPVGNTPGVLTDATADIALALLLSAARELPRSSRDAREGYWQNWSPTGWLGADLRGATLGIVGMGKIGQAVAQRAHAFGIKLIYNSNNRVPEIETNLGAEFRTLDELLVESDFVSLHCPLTAKTKGMIDRKALHKMKPEAILINTARGAVVDSDALVEALSEGWIHSAGLDVTDPEPLPPHHPLYALSNCIVLPHIGSATHGTRRTMADMACENLLAGLAGKKLPYTVNPQVFRER